VRPATTALLLAAGAVYALFAASCFRLAIEHPWERGVSVGEGLFVLLGAVALFSAARPRHRAAIVLVGTLPLVGWFLATPWNSGPPFLIASLVVPVVAATVLVLGARRRAPG
jgi:hypothetical protein